MYALLKINGKNKFYTHLDKIEGVQLIQLIKVLGQLKHRQSMQQDQDEERRLHRFDCLPVRCSVK